MPLVIHYPGVRPDIVKGESWKQLDESTAKLGQVYMHDLEDDHRIIANKSNWIKVDEYTEKRWQEMKDADEAIAAAQAKAKSEAEAAKNAKAAAATLALLESKTFRGRLRRLFGKKK